MTDNDGAAAYDDAMGAAESIQQKPQVSPGVGEGSFTTRPEPEVTIIEPEHPGDKRTARLVGKVAKNMSRRHFDDIDDDSHRDVQDAASEIASLTMEIARNGGLGNWVRGAFAIGALGLIFGPLIFEGFRQAQGEEPAE